ncbi:hypothetical protein DINM_005646 [Dirofilaria immitis]|nr:hypothetical protein [Dirofilaria immitis]
MASKLHKKTPASGEIFLTFRYVWTLALPILMFLMYISIFYNIHRKRKITTDQPKTNATSKVHAGHHAKTRINSGKYDRSMLIQAAMVCGAIEIQAICFYFLSPFAIKIAGEKQKFQLISSLTATLSSITPCCPPLIWFL